MNAVVALLTVALFLGLNLYQPHWAYIVGAIFFALILSDMLYRGGSR